MIILEEGNIEYMTCTDLCSCDEDCNDCEDCKFDQPCLCRLDYGC